jgi:lysophospholipase L1-like esterase
MNGIYFSKKRNDNQIAHHIWNKDFNKRKADFWHDDAAKIDMTLFNSSVSSYTFFNPWNVHTEAKLNQSMDAIGLDRTHLSFTGKMAIFSVRLNHV